MLRHEAAQCITKIYTDVDPVIWLLLCTELLIGCEEHAVATWRFEGYCTGRSFLLLPLHSDLGVAGV